MIPRDSKFSTNRNQEIEIRISLIFNSLLMPAGDLGHHKVHFNFNKVETRGNKPPLGPDHSLGCVVQVNDNSIGFNKV